MASITSSDAVPRPINKLGLTLAAMIGMISMIMSSTMVNVAVPDIMGAFGIGQDKAHWMATGFNAAMTVSMLLNAFLVTNFGPRNVFITAVTIFCLSSLFGQFAPTYEGVVIARVTQGLCAGLIQPLAMSVVFLAYKPEERGKAMGWFGMGVVIGPAIGPTLGGLIVDSADWRYVFTGALPFLVLAAILATLYLPGRDINTKKAKLNLPSFMLITATTTLFLNGITSGKQLGWETQATFLMLFGSASCLIAFIVLEMRSKNPLINIRLFLSKTYVASSIVGFVFGVGMFGSIYLTPIMVQTVHQFTATEAGLMLLPGSLVAMITFPIAGRMSQTVAPAKLIVFGLVVFGASCWSLTFSDMATGFWTLAIMVAGGRIGLGFVIPSLNLSAMASVGPEEFPYAAGTLNFIRMTGAAVGTNVLAILTEDRIEIHREAIVATQTADNEKTMETLHGLVDRFAEAGLAEPDRMPAALSYLSRMIGLKANDLAFQDGFMTLTYAFAFAALITVVLMRKAK